MYTRHAPVNPEQVDMTIRKMLVHATQTGYTKSVRMRWAKPTKALAAAAGGTTLSRSAGARASAAPRHVPNSEGDSPPAPWVSRHCGAPCQGR